LTQLRPRVDRIGLVLISLALFFVFLPVGYEVLMFPDGYSAWVTVSLVLGGLSVLAFVFYQSHRQNHMKNKQKNLMVQCAGT
jgi:hypothetical protein